MGSFRFAGSLLLAAALAAGCRTYDERTREARELYYRGDYAASAAAFESLRGSGGGGSDACVDLELAVVHLAAGDPAGSSARLESADAVIDVIDYTSDPASLGRYLYSEESGLFRARPYEKVLLSALNLLNYAARGKLAEARTEANLLYSKLDGIQRLENTTAFDSALVYLLVGLLDEILQPERPGQALIAYEKAYERLKLRSLARVMARLAKRAGDVKAALLRRLRSRLPAEALQPPGPDEGELVVVVLSGRGPVLRSLDAPGLHRSRYGQSVADPRTRQYLRDAVVAELVARAAAAGTAQAVSEEKVQEQITLYLQSPQLRMAVLQPRGSRFSAARVEVDGGPRRELEKALDLERQALAWFDSVWGNILRAALARAALRLAAALSTQAALEDDLGAEGSLLTGWLVQQTLRALDTPDTRCWSLIPKDVFFERLGVKAGRRAVRVSLSGPNGARRTLPAREVEIHPGKISFAVFLVTD